jgi:cyanophycinase-like exopeptidase
VHNSTKGAIVLGGGYFDRKETSALLRRVIDLAGGAGTFLVIIPTADPLLEPAVRTGSPTSLIDYEREARLRFASLGVRHVQVLHTRDRPVADSDEFTRRLRSASCVWIPGGDPEPLFKVYPNTIVQRELQGVLDRGGVIAGDSAGAMFIGQGLLAIDLENSTRTPPVREDGLRLLRNAFVLPHLNRYQAGIPELGCKYGFATNINRETIRALRESARPLGIKIKGKGDAEKFVFALETYLSILLMVIVMMCLRAFAFRRILPKACTP